MANVTATHLTTSQDDQDRTTYTTASISPSANKLVLLSVYADVFGLSSNTSTPSVTGAGMTWTEVVSVGGSGADSATAQHLYRALSSSPGSGALSITFGQTQARCGWSIAEFGNVDTSGSNGANAIVQTATGIATGTSKTLTLGSFGSSQNATYGAFSIWANETINVGSGFTQLGLSANFDTRRTQSQWRNDNDTSVDASWSSNVKSTGIAAELKFSIPSTGSFLLNFI